MMKQYNLCVANYKNWLLNRDIIKLLDLKQVVTKIERNSKYINILDLCCILLVLLFNFVMYCIISTIVVAIEINIYPSIVTMER